MQFQRFWLWAKRQNHTYRPNRPLSPQEEAQLVRFFSISWFVTYSVDVYFTSYSSADMMHGSVNSSMT